ncbi:1069_t:CDS:2 [Funneliformis geosporum]|uniref:6018_t:CDS:1 n=1 Tax=Funneliformis geosporum TaxID=1117311 RepID=A0A9W4WZF5_9GLOM|nr:1069_t:CDS:2 [Funneliformis geosporum]CAI2175038.1 6018_t:CDS:2 [Funneliformis geosporum]
MTGLLKLTTVLFLIFTLATSQVIKEFNTPTGPISQGANVMLSWSFVDGADVSTATGLLNAKDATSQNTVTIDEAVPLAPGSYNWLVTLPPSTYNLGLNDGSGFKFTAPVEIVEGKVPTDNSKSPNDPKPSDKEKEKTDTTVAPTSDPTAAKSTSPTIISSTPNDSAPSILSGTNVAFSLLAVAIAMLQF